MVDLMGGSAGALARVIGCFFFGLAIGSALGAWLAGRVRHPWWWLAGAELGLIIFCLPMLLLPFWSDGIWVWLGPERFINWQGAWLKTLLSVGLVLPASTLMGLFLPLAVVGWPHRRDTNKYRDHGIWLYALNTFGAVAGIVAVVFVLLPRGGVFAGMLWILAGNALIVLCCTCLAIVSPARQLQKSFTSGQGSYRPEKQLLLMAAASGFLVLGVEVTAIIMVQLLAPLSIFAPAVILAVFIGTLAVAGFCVALMPYHRVKSGWLLSTIPLLAGLALLAAPFLFHALAPFFSFEQDMANLWSFFLVLSAFVLVVFGPAILIGGLWFPLVARAGENADDPRSAERWGWLLAANGVGGWLGAEMAFAGLLPLMGMFGTLSGLAFLYFLCSWLFRPAGGPKWIPWIWGFSGTVILTAQFLLIPSLPPVNPQFVPYVVEHRQGREGALAVIEHPLMGRALLVQNQYILGSSAGTREQQRQADWPLLLHTDPRHVAFLGVATGITPGAALRHPQVEKVYAVEISSDVVAAAGRWFAEDNLNLLDDPRAVVLVEDARTWLAAQRPQSFDVIVSDLFLPWGPGDGRLYTIEHFSAARRALQDDGLFALWLPLYQLTNDHVMVILNTFLEVFPEAELIQREVRGQQPTLGVIGWNNMAENKSIPRKPTYETRLQVPAMPWEELHLGTIRRGDIVAPKNTLGNLWIEWQAGRLRLLRPVSAPYLSHDRGNIWLQSVQQQLTGNRK